MDERPPLRHGAPRGLDANAELLQPALRPAPERVVAQRGQEQALAGEPRELHRRDRSTAGRVLPGVERVDDLARGRDVLDPCELDPLHVSDDGDAHRVASLTGDSRSVSSALTPSADSKPTVLVARLLPPAGMERLARDCEISEGGLDVTPRAPARACPWSRRDRRRSDRSDRRGPARRRGAAASGRRQLRRRPRQRRPRRLPRARRHRHQHPRRADRRDRRAGARADARRRAADDRGRGATCAPAAGQGSSRARTSASS